MSHLICGITSAVYDCVLPRAILTRLFINDFDGRKVVIAPSLLFIESQF